MSDGMTRQVDADGATLTGRRATYLTDCGDLSSPVSH